MRSKLLPVFASVALLIPVFASAQQQSANLQRAQVRSELKSLEQAGYTPGYPASLSAAQDRLALGVGTDKADTTGYGPSSQGSFQAGHSTNSNTAQSVYFGL